MDKLGELPGCLTRRAMPDRMLIGSLLALLVPCAGCVNEAPPELAVWSEFWPLEDVHEHVAAPGGTGRLVGRLRHAKAAQQQQTGPHPPHSSLPRLPCERE
jgi:hypothetical protein